MHLTKVGIVIQARMGSARLPDKMGKIFYQNKSLVEVVFQKFANSKLKSNVVVATTENKKDILIADIAQQVGVAVYKGSELDVLDRYVKAAKAYSLDVVVRVCADNPFISIEYIQKMISEYLKDTTVDYLSYSFPDGTPVIKSHIGLFAEIVRVSALEKVNKSIHDGLYHEHVTNYIYSHPEQFKVSFLPVPEQIAFRKDIRLTIDTALDFETTSAIYKEFAESEQSLDLLIQIVDKHPEYLKNMLHEINKNEK